MKKPARHLKKRRHSGYNRKMGSDTQSSQTTPLGKKINPLYLVGIIILAILMLSTAYKLYQQKSAPQKKQLTSELPKVVLENTPLTCPLPSSFCKNKDSYKAGSFSATLKEGAPIHAPFDGIAKGSSSSRLLPNGKKEIIQFLTILDQKQEYGATYFFKGEIFKQKAVKENEIIATASGEPMSVLDGKSIVLFLIKHPVKGGQLEPLSPTNFK